MKLYQYLFLVDRIKGDYQKKKSTITNPHEQLLLELDYGLETEFLEKMLSINNSGDSTFRLVIGNLTFPHKMDNGKEVNSVEEMFFELCKGDNKCGLKFKTN